MHCIETRRLFPLHLSGELSHEERARADAHLATCEACSEELAQQRRYDDLLAEAFEDAPLDDSALVRALRKEMAVGPARSSKSSRASVSWRRRIHAPRFALAAAVACLAFSIVILLAARRTSSDLYTAAIEDHVEDVVLARPKAGWIHDAVAARAFVAHHLGEASLVDRLAMGDSRFLKVKICRPRGVPFVHLVYQGFDGLERSVFLARELGRDDLVARHNGAQSLVAFGQAGLTLIVVSDVPPADMLPLASRAAAALA